MRTLTRFTPIIALVLTAPFILAGQKPVDVDLVSETSNPDLEYRLEMGSVLRNGAPSADMAICLTRVKVTKKGLIPEKNGELVVFINADKKVVNAIATAGEYCKGPDCTEIRVKTADHNFELDNDPVERTCTDPSGIAKQFGLHEVKLAELRPITEAKIDTTITTIRDDSLMLVEVAALGLWQTCQIPSRDTDVRFGRNWFADLWTPSPWMPGYSLYVCSEGVRVCSFSNEFMADPTHQAVIRANDLHNTVVHASSAHGYHGGHECGLARDRGFLGRYRVDGWDDGWQIGLWIYGEDGNDWVIASPNPDIILGGDGDDLLRGMGGLSNRIYGEDGHDIMHDSPDGVCDGGLPVVDTHCAVDPWEWPDPYPAGDCCCTGCGGTRSCFFFDATPGVAEVPPDPW